LLLRPTDASMPPKGLPAAADLRAAGGALASLLLAPTSTMLSADTAKLFLHLGHWIDRPLGMAAAVFNLAVHDGQVMENGMARLGVGMLWCRVRNNSHHSRIAWWAARG
jgi:hypothetical protein